MITCRNIYHTMLCWLVWITTHINYKHTIVDAVLSLVEKHKCFRWPRIIHISQLTINLPWSSRCGPNHRSIFPRPPTQFNMDILLTRGSACPLNVTVLLSLGHLNISLLLPQYFHRILLDKLASESQFILLAPLKSSHPPHHSYGPCLTWGKLLSLSSTYIRHATISWR